jgi:hypothetical protein
MDQGALEGAMDDTSDGSEKSDGWYKWQIMKQWIGTTYRNMHNKMKVLVYYIYNIIIYIRY